MGSNTHRHAPIRLRELRIAADITGKALADKVGIPVWIIYQIENGSANPLLHKDAMKSVAKALGTTLAELLKPATATPTTPAEPNLPAVVPKPRMPVKRGRPPAPSAPGEMVEISIAVGGNLIGGIQTRDTKAMRAVLRGLFGDDDGK